MVLSHQEYSMWPVIQFIEFLIVLVTYYDILKKIWLKMTKTVLYQNLVLLNRIDCAYRFYVDSY